MAYLICSVRLKLAKSLFVSIVLLYSNFGICAPMDLKDLVEYGLENSPDLKNSKNNLKVSELSEDNAFSAFFPSLDLTAVHGYRNGNPASRTNPWASELGRVSFLVEKELSLSEQLRFS